VQASRLATPAVIGGRVGLCDPEAGDLLVEVEGDDHGGGSAAVFGQPGRVEASDERTERLPHQPFLGEPGAGAGSV